MLILSTAIAGLAAGAAYALVGIATLVTYRFVAVMNFSQTAVGAFGAFVMVTLYNGGLNLALAILLGIATSAALNLLIGLALVYWFRNGSPAVKTAVTIVVFTGLIALGSKLFSGFTLRSFPAPLSVGAFDVAGVTVTWLVIVSCLLAVALAGICAFVLARTHTGLQLQAISSRPTTALLQGIPGTRIALSVWTATGALTALALMLVAPQFPSNFVTFAMLITPAFAAALVGRFHSFWWTLAGGLGLGVLQGALSSITVLQQLRGAVPFIVILALLLWSQRHKRYEELA
ncbi:MAG TPA: branched-chain amino acid ABC transporter permease [Microbacteriaceae bacterium]|nr:branched-chain amino acid ABC transporter permease [Microbacteriaceae bacterium]